MAKTTYVSKEALDSVKMKVVYGDIAYTTARNLLHISHERLKVIMPFADIQHERKLCIGEYYMTHTKQETMDRFRCSDRLPIVCRKYYKSYMDSIKEKTPEEDKAERIAIARDIHLRVRKNVEEARLRRKREAERRLEHHYSQTPKQIV